MYSGFYKHYVEPSLPEAFRIFELMGYVRCPGENRSLLRLAAPIDPDAVILAYLDCFIAAIECDVRSTIQVFHVMVFEIG